MAETGFPGSPKILKGAFVQLTRDIVGVVPNIVAFQYNPEKLTHTITPWNPFEAEPTARGTNAPSVQPFEPRETFNLTIEVDATDPLEDGDPVAEAFGVTPQLAALKKLVVATDGLLGDIKRRASALIGQSSKASRPTVPVLLFVWGPGRILPVRITTFSIEETLFSPLLFPIQASVTLAMEVLTPDLFKCQDDVAVKIAVAAYNATRLAEDSLAIASADNTTRQILAMLPL
jgi:hypothetical protein